MISKEAYNTWGQLRNECRAMNSRAGELCYATAFMSRLLVAAAFGAILLSPLSGETRWAGDGNLPPHIGIYLNFDREPPPAAVQEMEREVGVLLAGTGARLSWLMLNHDERPQTFDDLAVLRFRGNCRMPKPGPLAAADGGKLTLGSTEMTSGRVTSYSSVECDQITACIASLLQSACEPDRQIAFSRALGRVVAHELYHILAHTRKHTHAGISKGLQSPFDLIKEHFQLDRQALLLLRSGR
jgi:hypothetical protein